MTEGFENLSALVLAGGLGTRLAPVVSDRPKPLADVGGRPFLAELLRRLAAAGLRHAVLCTGHLGDMVRAEFGASFGPLALDYSQEASPMGTAGALRLGAEQARSGTVLALNGDSLMDLDFAAFHRFHLQHPGEGSLALARVEDATVCGRVELDPQGRITVFREKDPAPGPAWVNGGLYLLPRAWLLDLPRVPSSLEREVFPAWIPRLWGFPTEGPLLDIGTSESYRRAQQLLAPPTEATHGRPG